MKWTTALMAIALTTAIAATYSPAIAQPLPQASQEMPAQAKSWTGKVEQKEVQGTKRYVLVAGAEQLPLEPQDKAAGFVGKTVKITGKMDGGNLLIQSIEEA